MKAEYDDQEDETDVDWKQHLYQEDKTQQIRPLDATDYVALFIASLQTIFLPIVILIVVLVAFAFIFTLFF
ncbi:MAG: hypothetical protein PVG65_06980 [Candidatus Thorarchaeota archaeon]|jgi:hypothetical protein